MNILPYKISVFFHYECPHCNNEITCSLEQIKNTGIIQCSCGTSTSVNKVKECDIDPIFDNKVKFIERQITRVKKNVGFVEPIIVKKTKKDNGFLDLAVSGLVNLGYKKGEAHRIVLQHLEVYAVQDDFNREFQILLKNIYKNK
jgi:DNA-directed RNA polymerase subunit RPC12/RpoP